MRILTAFLASIMIIDLFVNPGFMINWMILLFDNRSGVTQIGSHQFKVSPNDLIYTEKLKHCDINDKVCLISVYSKISQVLLSILLCRFSVMRVISSLATPLLSMNSHINHYAKFDSVFSQLMLNKVLMLGSKDQTIIGRPTVPKAAVFAVVEEHVWKSLYSLISDFLRAFAGDLPYFEVCLVILAKIS